ncbi:hypothetical protein CEXT_242011 [Caerostris extrusa]|uniref:Uncharacterized protein n=1 Tax=Caerostris extrusa TaxID=172846 RepID=A0AAV4WIP0_CAEEX|nr:hypothetical protein CEXT_242011 [Caerostris extrusa]
MSDAASIKDVSPSIPPITGDVIANCNLVLQEICRNFPTTTNHFAKKYIKIFPEDNDGDRKATDYLSASNFEYCVIKLRNERSQGSYQSSFS